MAGNPTRLALFIGDLKRRGVTRLASIYAVAGLGIIEAFDIIGGRFMLPDWSFKAVIILAIAGFPLALILGWIYDINFVQTLQCVQERGYLEMIRDVLPKSEKIAEIFNVLQTYINEKISLSL